jgi:hypothetical protein
MKTLKDFLQATGFKRGTNHPCVTTLKLYMEKLKCSEELQIDIMSFFLYDHESV